MLIVFPKPKGAQRHPAFLTEEMVGVTTKLNIPLPNPSEKVAVLFKGYQVKTIRNRPVVTLQRGRPSIRYRSVRWAKEKILETLDVAVMKTEGRVKPVQVWLLAKYLSMFPTYAVVITNRKAYTLDTVPSRLTVTRYLMWGYVLFLFP